MCKHADFFFFSVVASYPNHSGDGRFPGEEAWRCERALHPAVNAGLPGKGNKMHPVMFTCMLTEDY